MKGYKNIMGISHSRPERNINTTHTTQETRQSGRIHNNDLHRHWCSCLGRQQNASNTSLDNIEISTLTHGSQHPTRSLEIDISESRVLPEDIHGSSSDEDENNSKHSKIQDTLTWLEKQYNCIDDPHASKLPDHLVKLKNIIGYASNLRAWITDNNAGMGTEIGSEEIDTIQWLVKRACSELSLALKNGDGSTGQGDKASKDPVAKLTKIARHLHAWDQYRLGRDDRPPTRRELKRRKHIEYLLKELPKPGERPRLSDLPKGQQWDVFIDKANPEDVKKKSDPPYKQSMEELLEKLTAEQTSVQNKMSYKRYTKLHKYATKHLPDNGVPDTQMRSFIRELNGLNRGDPTGYSSHYLMTLENKLDQQEQLAALEEMRGEFYNGLPLYQDWPTGVEQPRRPSITPEIAHALPQGIAIGQRVITDDFTLGTADLALPQGSLIIRPLYSTKLCPKLVDAILNSYEGKKASNQTEYQILREIARTVRAIYVMHPKRDANGRTNEYGLLNELLEKAGFSPTKLPKRPDGPLPIGEKTLDGFVEDILVGMHNFIKEVNQYKQQVITGEISAEMS